MAPRRTFSAIIDQDSVILVEYAHEKTGFRLIGTWDERRRFATADAAAESVIRLLRELGARRASLSVVLQHFGSFFHSLVLPEATDDVIRPIVLREVQRSFNVSDVAVAWSRGDTIERRGEARTGGSPPRQLFVAGVPNEIIVALHARFTKARVHVQGVTVIPEVLRRLYDSLDGSNEATAMLLCLHNGPHVGFFVNGRLELAIEPPLALEGEAPLDEMLVIDQLERGAIFLRQQSRGTVATRLLLASRAEDYESLAATIERRTGMHVAPIGQRVGPPESVAAMGAILAASSPDAIDLYPRAPTFDDRLKDATTGWGLATSTLFAAAAVAAFWCVMQLLAMQRARGDIERLQAQVGRSLPPVLALRESATGREQLSNIRAALEGARNERRALGDVLSATSAAIAPGARLDSIVVQRVVDGLRTRVFAQASGPTGPAAMGAATTMYRSFQTHRSFSELEFESSYVPRGPTDPRAPVAGDDLRFVISLVAAPGPR